MPSETAHETTGVEFVLYASSEERKAIQVVDLFLECCEAVYREDGREMLRFSFLTIHKCLPEYTKALSLHLSQREEALLLAADSNGRSPALTLWQRAYSGSCPGSTYQWIIYLAPREAEEVRASILAKADAVSVYIDVRHYEYLVGTARALLKAKETC